MLLAQVHATVRMDVARQQAAYTDRLLTVVATAHALQLLAQMQAELLLLVQTALIIRVRLLIATTQHTTVRIHRQLLVLRPLLHVLTVRTLLQHHHAPAQAQAAAASVDRAAAVAALAVVAVASEAAVAASVAVAHAVVAAVDNG